MKPFDLERAKAGDPIVTRLGHKAKFIAHVREAIPDARVVMLINGKIYAFKEDGKVWSLNENEHDLFMAPKKHTVWINAYLDYSTDGEIYDTEEEANQYAGPSRIGNKAWPMEISYEQTT